MQFKVPSIKEINCELRDFEYYFDLPFDQDELGVSYHVRTSFSDKNTIIFFLHFRYTYGSNNRSLYHTDYLSLINVNEDIKEEDEMVKIDKDYLSHLLGTSILMIRGSMHERLSKHILKDYPFPIINPRELLEDDLTFEDDKFFIIIDKD